MKVIWLGLVIIFSLIFLTLPSIAVPKSLVGKWVADPSTRADISQAGDARASKLTLNADHSYELFIPGTAVAGTWDVDGNELHLVERSGAIVTFFITENGLASHYLFMPEYWVRFGTKSALPKLSPSQFYACYENTSSAMMGGFKIVFIMFLKDGYCKIAARNSIGTIAVFAKYTVRNKNFKAITSGSQDFPGTWVGHFIGSNLVIVKAPKPIVKTILIKTPVL